MARRRKAAGPGVSLFPFLSILACVIGVLTLLITALALGQLDPQEIKRVEQELAEQKERAEQYRLVTATNKDEAETLKVAEAKLATIEAKRDEIEKLREQAAALSKERDALRAAATGPTAEEAKKLAERMKTVETERTELRKQVDALKAELADREKPPEAARVVIEPTGTGTDLKPTFVECDARGVIIHNGASRVRVARAEMATNEAFIGLLDAVADAEKRTIVFLMRKEGVGTYYTARSLAYQHYAHNGKLPVTSDGEIDLSLFNEKRK